MIFELVSKGHEEPIDRVDMSNVGVQGAKTYFMGIKQMEEKEFDKLWKVMSEQHYNTQKDLANREGKQYEWWKDDEDWLDIDKP